MVTAAFALIALPVFSNDTFAQLAVSPRNSKQTAKTKLFAADIQSILTADKRKSDAQFEQAFTHMPHHRRLDIAFVRFVGEAEKIEILRAFQKLLDKIRLRFRQRQVKIRDSFALPQIQTGFDLNLQNIPAPAVFDGLVYVEFAFRWILYLVQNTNNYVPKEFCATAVAQMPHPRRFRQKPSYT